MLGSTAPAFLSFILAVKTHDYQFDFAHGYSDLMDTVGHFNGFMRVLHDCTDPIWKARLEPFLDYVLKNGERVVKIGENNPSSSISSSYLYYEAIANHRLDVLQQIRTMFSPLYNLNQIQHMESIIQLLQNMVDEKSDNMKAKMETSKIIHNHLMEVAMKKENSPLMREVELLLQNNPFNKNS